MKQNFQQSLIFCAAILFLAITLGTKSGHAQFYVPIPGIDGTNTQYSCKGQSGVPSTIQEIKANGALAEKTVTSVTKSLNKQIAGKMSKVASLTALITNFQGSAKQKTKLKNQKAAAAGQVKALKYIRARVKDCKDGVLTLGGGATARLLFVTFPDPRPGYSGVLSGFVYGFVFNPPKNWTNHNFCATMSGASGKVTSLGASGYADFTEVATFIRGDCANSAGVDYCVAGLLPGQFVIVLAQGLINENPGSCGNPPERCSISEIATKLDATYGGAILHSLRLAPLGKYCF